MILLLLVFATLYWVDRIVSDEVVSGIRTLFSLARSLYCDWDFKIPTLRQGKPAFNKRGRWKFDLFLRAVSTCPRWKSTFLNDEVARTTEGRVQFSGVVNKSEINETLWENLGSRKILLICHIGSQNELVNDKMNEKLKPVERACINKNMPLKQEKSLLYHIQYKVKYLC